MLKINQIWNNILLETEAKVSTLQYDLYINQLQPVGIYRDRLILLAETRALKNIVDNNYKDTIKKCANLVFPSIIDIEIITEDDLENVGNVQKEVDLPVSSNYVSIVEDKAVFVSQYTFDTFVVGKSNEYAEAVARTVAENSATKYNPVFLWGGVGLGKTHLMHAIGNSLQRNFPNKKIMYVTCDQFVNEFIESLHDTTNPNAMKNFRSKYRKVDVLMMDDVQFLANKEGTQEEMFHTFNELYLADKQIILSSDRPPKEIKIEERLKTRFATGVIADIQPPDLETRIAILQKKCGAKGYNLTIDVLSLIAEKITNNIREMEGMLNRIISYSTLVGGDPNNMDIVCDALRDYADATNDIITIDRIVKSTCEYFNVKREDIIGKKKNKEIVVPRQICIYLICDILGQSIPLVSIGEYFGGRDHTTVMHARDKISEECKNNDRTASQVKDIRDKIYNR
ncbi:MAG: chromosomal replication initiator protein DnaA [Corallococcus sp.]|nr:chromosomal replication initiator protein DnaA [Bacillota bacterium]MCM1533213.1 chromosomal replication initiator protein DnaA [Corallococcus sp.]